jgi:hypothetical protein
MMPWARGQSGGSIRSTVRVTVRSAFSNHTLHSSMLSQGTGSPFSSSV